VPRHATAHIHQRSKQFEMINMKSETNNSNLEIMKYIVVILFIVIWTKGLGQSSGELVPSQVKLTNTYQCTYSSQINDVGYKLYISLPPSYGDSSKSFPVVYLLDADYSFALAKNITDHLSERNHLDEVIIVGIAYEGENNYRLHRTRDYTPVKSLEGGYTKELQERYSGGGPKFLEVIEQELIPFINSNYNTNNQKIISGHSFGGLFCSWILYEKPNLFDGYIIVSPSMWYSDHFLLQKEFKLLATITQTKKIYLTVGDREVSSEWNMPEDLKRFQGKLEKLSNSNLKLRMEIEEDQTHNSIFPIGLSDGLRYVLNGI